MVTAQRGDYQITRNSSLFKRINPDAFPGGERVESESDSEYNHHIQLERHCEAPTLPGHNPLPVRRNPLRKSLPPKFKDLVRKWKKC